MICKKPFISGVTPFGCGQCNPCRINRRRLWAHRLLLEQLKHNKSSFVTLTYKDEALPTGGTLVKKHMQLWLKAIRSAIKPAKIRYYYVGEYGDLSQRPHYHAIIYGLDYGPGDTALMQKHWKHGHIFVGDLTKDSAAYVTGYVTKKWTKKDDARLNGRAPEFAQPSLKPGLGALVAIDIANTLATESGSHQLLTEGDVPMALQHGKKKMPLGRYLRRKIREAYGFENTAAQDGWQTKQNQEMHELLKNALLDPANKSKSLGQMLLDKNKQKVLNIENKHKILSTKGKL